MCSTFLLFSVYTCHFCLLTATIEFTVNPEFHVMVLLSNCNGFFSADWRHRHAALMAISACGEGCHQQMENVLASIVEAIIPFLQDPVCMIKVLWSSCFSACWSMDLDVV